MSNKGKGKNLQWLRDRVGHDGDDCLIWPFHRRWNGYGSIAYMGSVRYPHRVMCEFAHGAAPTPDHLAAHSCGRGQDGCVNPRHLSWKTSSENQLDRREHGTARRRKQWPGRRSLVSEEQRKQIRALKGRKNQREIAAMFGLSYQHVSLIQRGLRRQPKVLCR